MMLRTELRHRPSFGPPAGLGWQLSGIHLEGAAESPRRELKMSVWFMLGHPLALRSEWFLELLVGFGYSLLSKPLSTFQKHSLCSDPIICSFLSTKSRVRSAQRGKKTAIRYFCKFFLNYVTCIISNTFRWFVVTSCGSWVLYKGCQGNWKWWSCCPDICYPWIEVEWIISAHYKDKACVPLHI